MIFASYFPAGRSNLVGQMMDAGKAEDHQEDQNPVVGMVCSASQSPAVCSTIR
jgi:hypothetical protein